MKNDCPLNIKELTKGALHDIFLDNRKHHEAGIITQEHFEEYELAICEVLHNIFVVELNDAIANNKLMSGEPCKSISYKVCSNDSDHEVKFAGDDKFTYDLWMDVINALNKMKYCHTYIINEAH